MSRSGAGSGGGVILNSRSVGFTIQTQQQPKYNASNYLAVDNDPPTGKNHSNGLNNHQSPISPLSSNSRGSSSSASPYSSSLSPTISQQQQQQHKQQQPQKYRQEQQQQSSFSSQHRTPQYTPRSMPLAPPSTKGLLSSSLSSSEKDRKAAAIGSSTAPATKATRSRAKAVSGSASSSSGANAGAGGNGSSSSSSKEQQHPDAWRKSGKVFRANLILQDEEKGGNSFQLSKDCSIERYYRVAERVMEQFLSSSIGESEELTESYLVGSRLVKFLSVVLPTHPEYFAVDPRLSVLRHRSQEQLIELLQFMEELSLLIDEIQYNNYILQDLTPEDLTTYATGVTQSRSADNNSDKENAAAASASRTTAGTTRVAASAATTTETFEEPNIVVSSSSSSAAPVTPIRDETNDIDKESKQFERTVAAVVAEQAVVEEKYSQEEPEGKHLKSEKYRRHVAAVLAAQPPPPPPPSGPPREGKRNRRGGGPKTTTVNNPLPSNPKPPISKDPPSKDWQNAKTSSNNSEFLVSSSSNAVVVSDGDSSDLLVSDDSAFVSDDTENLVKFGGGDDATKSTEEDNETSWDDDSFLTKPTRSRIDILDTSNHKNPTKNTYATTTTSTQKHVPKLRQPRSAPPRSPGGAATTYSARQVVPLDDTDFPVFFDNKDKTDKVSSSQQQHQRGKRGGKKPSQGQLRLRIEERWDQAMERQRNQRKFERTHMRGQYGRHEFYAYSSSETDEMTIPSTSRGEDNTSLELAANSNRRLLNQFKGCIKCLLD